MVGSTEFILSVMCSISVFAGRRINMSSMYLKYVQLLGSLYLKEPDSRNSRKRHARMPLSGLPMGHPDFCR